MERAELSQPWVIYRYLTPDRVTRITGVSRIECSCMVCGDRTVLRLRIPRLGPVPDRGMHPDRARYLAGHLHPDRGAPMSWARPLENLNAHGSGLDLQALAMRLEADMSEGDEQ